MKRSLKEIAGFDGEVRRRISLLHIRVCPSQAPVPYESLRLLPCSDISFFSRQPFCRESQKRLTN